MPLPVRIASIAAGLSLAALASCTTVMPKPSAADLKQQVTDTERAFARTMADRNHAAFTSFLADDTIFFTSKAALRGKQAVAEFWKKFYDGPVPPFSWEPETVEVLASGTLALSTGPVRDPQGKLVATFTSMWRLEASGTWKIIFDKGNEVCDCASKP